MPSAADMSAPLAADRALDDLRVRPAAALAALAPPEPALLGPVAPGTITLIRGSRGVGKSWLALAMARAMAGGTDLLGWPARQAPVLYVEAAMGDRALGQRLRMLGPVPDALRVGRALPLGTDDDGRMRTALGSSKVLVLDGLSLQVNLGSGRAGQRWRELGEKLCKLREEGYAVVLVEHGKRALIESLADTILVLKPQASEADVAFGIATTSRQVLDRKDCRFGADLSLDGAASWRRHDAADPARSAAAPAIQTCTVHAGAHALGPPIATFWRELPIAKAGGLVNDKPRETDETATLRQARETPETTPPPQPRETDETRKALARASNGVLQRTLEKRRAAPYGAAPRPGPAILAAIADAALLDELARRRPRQAPRLMARYAVRIPRETGETAALA